ncbi:hypothetical protein [uncultured Mediterranean phage uvMED]|nr:hypothetical protein [uncultured Mediterranean phage uvMED]
MKVFNVHKTLRSILHDRIEISFGMVSNRTVNYGEGDLKELVKILSKKQEKYPMLWLSNDFVVNTPVRRGVSRISVDLTFFVMVDGSKTDLYYKRFEEKYENIIYPVVEAFIEIINKEKGVSVLNDTSLPISDFPYNDVNSFNVPKDQTMTINDIWDATKFTTTLQFSPECFEEKHKCNINDKKYKIK